ncbi:uncharacterized protein FFB20_15049 [Fusarium fujikuroi]|nr:uncharacterized protein FFM5_02272 [Fusarium fujikuroi]SCO16701.1 uncharacterized protein FFB20_15049 [Fusarium fujikuroi]
MATSEYIRKLVDRMR